MNPVNTKPYQLPADATWFVTGCSTGIGRALATHVASVPGQRLIATARDIASLSYLDDNNPAILKLALDVTQPSAVDAAFKETAAHFGDSYYIDVVVNNAGYSLSGDTESVTEYEMHDEFEVNFFGTVRVALKAIEVMRQSESRRGGLIFNFRRWRAFAPSLVMRSTTRASMRSKDGVSLLLERCIRTGTVIHVCIVEPSAVNTNLETSSKKKTKPHPAYAGNDMPARQLERFVKQGIASGVGFEPSAVANALYDVASRNEKVPLRLPLSVTAIKLITMKLQGQLEELEAHGALSALDADKAQFDL